MSHAIAYDMSTGVFQLLWKPTCVEYLADTHGEVLHEITSPKGVIVADLRNPSLVLRRENYRNMTVMTVGITWDDCLALQARAAALHVESERLCGLSKQLVARCDSQMLISKAQRLIRRLSHEPSSLLAIAAQIRPGDVETLPPPPRVRAA
jgi:hypothetical protein